MVDIVKPTHFDDNITGDIPFSGYGPEVTLSDSLNQNLDNIKSGVVPLTHKNVEDVLDQYNTMAKNGDVSDALKSKMEAALKKIEEAGYKIEGVTDGKIDAIHHNNGNTKGLFISGVNGGVQSLIDHKEEILIIKLKPLIDKVTQGIDKHIALAEEKLKTATETLDKVKDIPSGLFVDVKGAAQANVKAASDMLDSARSEGVAAILSGKELTNYKNYMDQINLLDSEDMTLIKEGLNRSTDDATNFQNAKRVVNDYGHTTLDWLSWIPGLNELTSSVNGAWYAIEGKMLDAALCAVALIPFGVAAKFGKKSVQEWVSKLSKESYEKLSKETLEALTKGTKEGKQALNQLLHDKDLTPGEWLKMRLLILSRSSNNEIAKALEHNSPKENKSLLEFSEGDPVNMYNGAWVDEQTDFSIDDRIPFSFKRYHDSQVTRQTTLGYRAWHNHDTFIIQEGFEWLYTDEKGSMIRFNCKQPFMQSRNATEPQFILTQLESLVFELKEGLYTHTYQLFGERWLKTKITHLEGVSHRYQRDETGLLERIYLSDHRYLYFKYEPSPTQPDQPLLMSVYLIAKVQPDQQTVAMYGNEQTVKEVASYRYQTNASIALLTQARCHFGLNYDYQWDKWCRIIEWKDSERTQIQFTYDEHNRVLSHQSNGAYHNARFEFDPDNRRSTYYSGNEGEVIHFQFDDKENLLWQEDAQGNRAYQTHLLGKVASITDPLGRQLRCEYDPRSGQLSRLTTPGQDHEYIIENKRVIF